MCSLRCRQSWTTDFFNGHNGEALPAASQRCLHRGRLGRSREMEVFRPDPITSSHDIGWST